MSMEIGSSHPEEETGDLMKAESDYPPALLRGGAPATATATHRRQIQAIPAPFMSFRPPTADTSMSHHQGQLGHHGGSRPPFNPPGSNPSAADVVTSTTQQRFTAISAVSRSAVGVYAPRRIWNPKSTLMTMFYNGAVNVFDIPMDKAREIMVLASRASVSSPPSAGAIQKSDSPVPANTARFPVPGARKIIIHSQASSLQPMQQASSVAVAVAIRPIAVHQSRKASLARFFEKRKEGVSSVTPYPLSKSPLESSGSLGSASTPSKLSRADIAPPSNNCQESVSMDMYNGASLTMSGRVIIELE